MFFTSSSILILLGMFVSTRIIAPDRPGYGKSDPKPRRTHLDWANDVAELADLDAALTRVGYINRPQFKKLQNAGGWIIEAPREMCKLLEVTRTSAPVRCPLVVSSDLILARVAEWQSGRVATGIELFHSASS